MSVPPPSLEGVSADEVVEVCLQFLERYALEQVEDILRRPDDTLHYGVNISFIDLLDHNLTLAHLLQAHPIQILSAFDDAIRDFENRLIDREKNDLETAIAAQSRGDPAFRFKPHVHARVCQMMPNCPETTKSKLPRSVDIDTLIEVRGTVIRTGMIKMLEWEREVECTRCKHRFLVHAELELGNQFPKITRCLSEKEPPCNSKNFRLIEGEKSCRDYQEIKIQEQIQKLTVGTIPRSMVVVLEDDLVDTCKAGDDITVTGVVMRRWKWLEEEKRCDLEMFICANYLRVNNEQRLGVTITDEAKAEFQAFWDMYKDAPMAGRDIIIRSVCPQVYGMFTIRLAVALVLIGGVQRVDPSGLKVRGESHLLLIGDPGTAKSQFLKYAAKLSPRSVLTTGIGTTSAGLTVTAVKDQGGEWMLEAGALVLADGGVCCIDEFSSIKKHDQATIHESMEQQTISVAKAGLVCKLSTKTTVIAATNPKAKYDKEQSISVNTALATPLLSRFDLIMVLLDESDDEWDRLVSQFILSGQQLSASGVDERVIWPLQRLQAYFSHVSNTLAPVLSTDAETVLGRYYQIQRGSDSRNEARTTLRLLESLIRLAQAHARLMYRNEVLVQDAIIAVQMVEMSMHNSSMLGVMNTVRSYAPQDSELEYRKVKLQVLTRLRLMELMDDTDKKYLDEMNGAGGSNNLNAAPPAPTHDPFDANESEDADTPSSQLSQASQERRGGGGGGRGRNRKTDSQTRRAKSSRNSDTNDVGGGDEERDASSLLLSTRKGGRSLAGSGSRTTRMSTSSTSLLARKQGTATSSVFRNTSRNATPAEADHTDRDATSGVNEVLELSSSEVPPLDDEYPVGKPKKAHGEDEDDDDERVLTTDLPTVVTKVSPNRKEALERERLRQMREDALSGKGKEKETDEPSAPSDRAARSRKKPRPMLTTGITPSSFVRSTDSSTEGSSNDPPWPAVQLPRPTLQRTNAMTTATSTSSTTEDEVAPVVEGEEIYSSWRDERWTSQTATGGNLALHNIHTINAIEQSPVRQATRRRFLD